MKKSIIFGLLLCSLVSLRVIGQNDLETVRSFVRRVDCAIRDFIGDIEDMGSQEIGRLKEKIELLVEEAQKLRAIYREDERDIEYRGGQESVRDALYFLSIELDSFDNELQEEFIKKREEEGIWERISVWWKNIFE